MNNYLINIYHNEIDSYLSRASISCMPNLGEFGRSKKSKNTRPGAGSASAVRPPPFHRVAFVDLNVLGANFGRAPNLVLRGVRPNGKGERRVFLRFGLSALAESVTADEIATAMLRLWVSEVRKPGGG